MLKITPTTPTITKDEVSKADIESMLEFLELGKDDISELKFIAIAAGLGDDGNAYSDVQVAVNFKFTFDDSLWFGSNGIAVNVSVIEAWAKDALETIYG